MEARTAHIAAAEARKRLCRGRPLIGPALEMSCWRGRKHGKYACDSSDYIDTERCLKKAFLADWSHTTGGQVLQADMKGRAFGVREGKLSKEIIEDIMDGLFAALPDDPSCEVCSHITHASDPRLAVWCTASGVQAIRG